MWCCGTLCDACVRRGYASRHGSKSFDYFVLMLAIVRAHNRFLCNRVVSCYKPNTAKKQTTNPPHWLNAMHACSNMYCILSADVRIILSSWQSLCVPYTNMLAHHNQIQTRDLNASHDFMHNACRMHDISYKHSAPSNHH